VLEARTGIPPRREILFHYYDLQIYGKKPKLVVCSEKKQTTPILSKYEINLVVMRVFDSFFAGHCGVTAAIDNAFGESRDQRGV